MKKLNVCVLAIAAMAMAMTSCNKEEALNQGDILVSVEENEITNGAKTHLDGDNLYWDNNDQLRIYDRSNNGAIYAANPNTHPTSFRFIQHVNAARPFDRDNAPLYAAYPSEDAYCNGAIRLPYLETTENGELKDFPMYGTGTFEHFSFKNVCGVLRLMLTGDATIDSITITTDKKVNGHFSIVNATEPTDVDNLSTSYSANNGTKTVALHIANPIQLNGDLKEVNMYIPATSYNVFNITFYAGNRTYTLRNGNNPITIHRTHYTTLNRALNAADFQETVYGSTNAKFKMGNQNVYIAKGNLMYIGTDTRKYYVADNGFDCIGTIQASANINTADRDVFAWGATSYKTIGGSNTGNGITIWPTRIRDAFACFSGSFLDGRNDWGWQSVKNLDNNRTWRTPTSAEAQAIITENPSFFANVMGVNGLVIVPAESDVEVPSTTTLTKAQWNELEAAGAAFLPVTYYRTTNAAAQFSNLMRNGSSLYWTANADENVEGNAMAINLGTNSEVASFDKKCGGFVRLISVVAE